MKAVIFFFLCTLFTLPTVFGQIKIGDNPQNIDDASVLELESSSKVLVITRVTTAQMEAIAPQRGGMVYNTDTACIHYFDGTQWINLCDAVSFTITNDPIINNRSTIEITQSEGGYNLEVAKNSILGDNIVDGGIGPDDIQDNSIGQEKLAAESVGSSELRENSVGSEELRDGTIVPTDIANTDPGRVLTTDENGIVQWEDANEIYELTFSKIDTTLSIIRSTTPGENSVNLASLIGSDDQNLGIASLTNEELTIEIENGASTTANLGVFATDADLTFGLSLKEDLINKDPNPTLGTSNDAYPTQNAVKTYVDSQIGGVTTDDDITSATFTGESVLRINEGASFVEVSLANLEESQDIEDETLRATLAENENATAITNLQTTRENVINKNPDTNLGTSDTDYPTQNAVKVYVDNEIADIVTSGGSDPVNEQNLDFEVIGGELRITDIAGPLSVPLSLIDTNTQLTDAEIGAFGYIKTDLDEQNLADVLILGNNAGSNPIIGLDISTDPTSAATRGYVDNEIAGLPAGSDNQTAAEVPITATPVNYTPTAANVEGHLEGIDTALLNSGSTEEADGITITGIGTPLNPFKIEPSTINGQFLRTDVTTGNVIWDNLPTGTTGTVISDGTTITGDGLSTPLAIALDGITTAQILNGTIISDDLATNSIETVTILDGTILAEDIADNNITPAKIEQGANGEILTTDINGDVVWAVVPLNSDEQSVDEFGWDGINTLSISLDNDGEVPQTVNLSSLEESFDILANTTAITANTTAINTKEDAANKSNDATLADNSAVDFPTEQAVKTYVDNQVGAITAPTIVSEDADNAISVSAVDGGAFYDDNALTATTAANTTAITANTTAINTKEDAANKSNDATLADNSAVDFPTEQAVKTYVDNQVGAITAPTIVSEDADNAISVSAVDGGAFYDDNALTATTAANTTAITANTTAINTKEDAANKSNDATLADNSAVDFPTEQAVKTYVDNQVGAITAPTIVSEDADNAISVSAVDGGAFYDDNALTATTAANTTAITLNTTAINTKEDAANKSNDATLADNSAVDFPTEQAVKTYVDNQVGAITAPTIVSEDADNAISVSAVDGGAFYDDNALTATTAANTTAITANTTAINTKEDAANKSNDATLADNSAVDFPTEQAVKTYVDTQVGGIIAGNNFSNANLTLNADRTHDLNGSNLVFLDNSGLPTTGNVGIGNLPGAPQSKLDVSGQIQSRDGFASTGGTAGNPGYGFYTDDDTNTGMFRPAADEIGFSAGGQEALRIEEDGGSTSVIVFESLELNNLLLDKDGESGTAGQILSSTGGQTDWVDNIAFNGINASNSFIGNGTPTNQLTIASDAIGTNEIDNGSVLAEDISPGVITNVEIAANTVNTSNIEDGTLVNEDIAGSAAIEGFKINPNFGTQNIFTLGDLDANRIFVAGVITHPDYVFQKYFTGTSTLNDDYSFKSLKEIETFVKQNNHLPGIKSAAAIKEQGFWNLGEASRMNLEKIEELFLHTIEQEKKIKTLQEENRELAKQMDALKLQVAEIKKLLAKGNE